MNPATDAASEERSGPPAWYWLIPLAVALLRALPFLATRIATPPPGTVYPPIGYNPIDAFAYIGFVRQAAETGDWLLVNPHTVLPQDGRYFLPLFSLLGWACRITGLSPFTALELARVPLLFGFFAVLWSFTHGLLPDRRQRLLAVVLVAFSGGLEFLAHQTLNWWPPGWHRPLFEAVSDDHGWSVFASLNNPLWIAGLTLGLLALEAVLKPGPDQGWSGAIRILGWTVATFLVHPYSGLGVIAISAGVLVVRAVCRESEAGRARLVIGLTLALAVVGAVSWWQNQDAVFHATARGFFGRRNVAPLWYPLTLGALGLLAAWGAGLRWRDRTAGTRELLVWAGVAMLLHSSPWTNGYHFVFLLPLPLCLLAAPALDSALRIFEDDQASASRQFAAAAVLALAFQSALAVTWRTTRLALAYSVPAPVMAAVESLAREPAGRVYTSPHVGTILTAYTPHRVVVGHWFLTPEHSARQKRYTDLMAGRVAPADFVAELRRDGVGFVLLPPGTPSEVAGALAAASGRVEALGNYGLFHLR